MLSGHDTQQDVWKLLIEWPDSAYSVVWKALVFLSNQHGPLTRADGTVQR